MKLIKNLLVLMAVIGFGLSGWLVGHILRFSIPAYYHQHPPNPEIDSKLKNGFEPEASDKTLVSQPGENPWVRVYSGAQPELAENCLGTTYYTSLPARCRTISGEWVAVGGGPQLRPDVPPGN